LPCSFTSISAAVGLEAQNEGKVGGLARGVKSPVDGVFGVFFERETVFHASPVYAQACAWFVELVRSRERRDRAREGLARQRLRELGVFVRFRERVAGDYGHKESRDE
jgi:hypothetical protein